MGHDALTWRAMGYHTDQWIGWLLPLAAEWWPDRDALVLADERITFAALAVRSRQIAAQLTALGIGPGDTVSWTLGNSVDAVAVASAIWHVGATSNPVVPIYRAHELTAVLTQVRPAAVVVPSDYRGRDYTAEFDEVLATTDLRLRGRIVAWEGRDGWQPLTTAAAGGDAPDIDVTSRPGDAPCLVLFTSGTTSAPKGAVHTSATLLHECRAMATDWALTWRDAMFMASPLTHITGLLQGFLVPAMTGATAVLQDRWDRDAAIELIESEGVTYAAGATPFLQGIVDAYTRRGTRPTTLRQFTSGGASVPPQLIEDADGLGIAAHRLWGMTELPTATRANDTVDLWHRAHTDGQVAIGVQAEAVDAQRQPLPPGSEGELRIRGPERMVGYLDPAMDVEAIDADGWFYTGDVGVVSADGFVSITGRIKEIINRGGEKFSVRDIEEAILRHPQVSDVAVVGVPDDRLGEGVAAVVVADVADAGALHPPLAGFLEDLGLARQKLPTTVVVATDLPRTASGKLRRNQIVDDLTTGRRP